jgi:hypothetical protein
MNSEDPAIRLMLGYLCVANEAEASLVRKVEILDRFGLSDSEISTICGVAQQSVRNARLTLKKSSKSNVKQK